MTVSRYCGPGGVGGLEKSESEIASPCPSVDQGSVTSRMGMTKRISLKGALGGSGGSMLSSMKSCEASRSRPSINIAVRPTYLDGEPARFKPADLDLRVNVDLAYKGKPIRTVSLERQL